MVSVGQGTKPVSTHVKQRLDFCNPIEWEFKSENVPAVLTTLRNDQIST